MRRLRVKQRRLWLIERVGQRGSGGTVGRTPSPANLHDVSDGEQTATLAMSLPFYAWTPVDRIARMITGRPLTKSEQARSSAVRFLQRKDMIFDPSNGYAEDPDFADRSTKLWNGVSGP
jgi:hypothetical protein